MCLSGPIIPGGLPKVLQDAVLACGKGLAEVGVCLAEPFADFTGSIFAGPGLTETSPVALSEVNLSEVNLSKVNLNEVNLDEIKPEAFFGAGFVPKQPEGFSVMAA